MPLKNPRSRIQVALTLVVVIVLGLGSRRFGAALPDFLADHAGDALWTVAVYLTLAFALPRSSAFHLLIASIAISFAVEFSQLIKVNWLDQLRDTLPGRLLLGQTFVWIDLARYTAGAILAYLFDLSTTRITNQADPHRRSDAA